ncbi:MAG: aldo/keto reductase [Wenzhouxiangellaceae bacterium]|nr:aldo/keto reductase [Wenzhouxiangellaceae bacterium]
MNQLDRRQLLKLIAAGAAVSALPCAGLFAAPDGILKKPIPSSGEPIPVIGMGTWKSFNVGSDRQLRLARTEVLREFFRLGGGLVDCSPMYGSSGEVLGFALEQLGQPDSLFAAEKVWTEDGAATRSAVAELESTWGIAPFDLMQIHNLVAWQEHLETLEQMKAEGAVRYIGITTSHGRRHDAFERVMANEAIDFVQLTYSITSRDVENRLLPLAAERGIAVIANMPYDRGPLIKGLKARAQVPDWAVQEFDCKGWADFLLKFVVSHPAMTCAIPSTSQVAHMTENMRAGTGPMPDAELRQRMVRHIESL